MATTCVCSVRQGVYVALLTLLLLAASANAQCSGTPNNHTIWTGTPRFVTQIQNAVMYAADAQPGNSLRIVHLFGTAYEMGFAHGTLLHDDILRFYVDFENYAAEMIAPYVKNLPLDIQHIIETQGVMAALAFTADLTKKFTPQRFFDEMRGLADALSPTVTYQQVVNVQMFPELIKASCSMFGAWGAATNDSLVQLRALDFGTDGPFANYPVMLVYHPSQEGHSFISLGWAGFIGSVTTYSQYMGVSEKVWIHYNETSSRAGIPFHFLLRDIGQFDIDLDDAINRMVNAERTCSIFVGIGSNSSMQFRVVEYAHMLLMVYDDKNFPAYPPEHPLMNGVVFIDKHTQPSRDPCLGSLMERYYGSLTPEITIRDILGPFQTGDLHAAVYDFGQKLLYVSVAGLPISTDGKPGNGIAPAYDRPWFRFDATALLAQAQSQA